MLSPLQHRIAAAMTALSLAIGLAAGPVHLHSHEHSHLGDDGQVVLHSHAHGHGHHADHDHTSDCEHHHAPGAPCEHDEDDCVICHFLGQAAVVVSIQLDTAVAPCFEHVPQSSPQCASALPPRLPLSRGPPQRDV